MYLKEKKNKLLQTEEEITICLTYLGIASFDRFQIILNDFI